MRKVLVSVVLFVSIVGIAACGGGGGSAGGSTSDFCNTLKADAAQFSNLGDQADEAQVLAALTDLANKAPSEIKADMTALVNAIKASSSYASQLSADPAAAASLASQFSSQGAALETSTKNIEKFAKDKCGVDLNSSDSSSSSSSSASGSAVSGDFCDQIVNVDPVSVANDPSGAKAAVATLKQLNPPSELASVWDDYVKAIEEVGNTDPNDTEKLSSIATDHIQSFSAVGAYISRSCLSAFSNSLSSFSS